MADLFIDSSNALASAEKEQRKISQKEFEIKLADINNRYSATSDSSAYYYNQQKKMLLETEVSSYKNQRDNYINVALLYALNLGELEVMRNETYSRASIALASICTFLTIQNIHISLSYSVIQKIFSLSSILTLHPSDFFSLRQSLNNLKTFLGI